MNACKAAALLFAAASCCFCFAGVLASGIRGAAWQTAVLCTLAVVFAACSSVFFQKEGGGSGRKPKP
jgi:hypothetical protein